MKKTPERRRLFSPNLNIGFNKKYTTIAIYAVLVLVFGVVCVYFLVNNDRYASAFSTLKGIVFPIFTGMVIAYVLNPFLKFFEEQVFISSSRRTLNKARRKLFKTKLAYDHLRNNPTADEKALASARSALTDARVALELAYAVDQAESDKKSAKLIAKAIKKNKRPSYNRPDAAPTHPHPYRGISLLCTYLVFLAILTLICWIVIPQTIESVMGFVGRIRSVIVTLPATVDSLITHNELVKGIYEYIRDFISTDVDVKKQLTGMLSSSVSELSTSLTGIVSALPAYVSTALSSITNIILAIFLSIYFLSSKEMLARQAHRVGKAFLSPGLYKGTCHVIREVDRKFGKFIEGKVLDSTIIGLLALIVLWLFKMPYYQMLALIIGVTNIIPFFGPIIGGVIGGAIMLITDPGKVIPFLIFVLILQQLDGNVIGPLILGDSVGLQPIWIMVAIVIMSGLFGFFGMLFGVPLFAVIYTLIREAVEKKLKKKRTPTNVPPPIQSPDDPET